MKLVAYCRVSTDDKGQDPVRQEEVIRKWADFHKEEVLAVIHDEGTSGSVTPLQRQRVLEAIEVATELGAEAIVVESVDRWTRGGVEDFFASSFLLRLKHSLQVVTTATPPGMSAEMVAVFHSMQAAGAKLYRDNMNRQIQAGIARAKRLGFPNGRPGVKPKPDLTAREKRLVEDLAVQGHGVDKAALEVSRARGAFDIDGTLLHHREKPDYLSPDSLALAKRDHDVCERVRSLIEAGTPIHFVTGRSNAVRAFTLAQLRSFIHPNIHAEALHTQVEFVGYQALAAWKGEVLRRIGATWYVGDHECDEQAAKAAGIPFQYAHAYQATSRMAVA